jgi:hypothetical protein
MRHNSRHIRWRWDLIRIRRTKGSASYYDLMVFAVNPGAGGDPSE